MNLMWNSIETLAQEYHVDMYGQTDGMYQQMTIQVAITGYDHYYVAKKN